MRRKHYRRDDLSRGLGTIVLCISMPAADLAALDAGAERLEMARSHLIREAVRSYLLSHARIS